MSHLKSVKLLAGRERALKKSRHQLGTTLVEWMVSIAIGLILLVGLVVMFAEQSKAQSELEKSSRQIENGRYAMQLLNEDLQMAGYYGEFSGSLDSPGSLPDSCSTAVSDLDAAMAFPVQGYAAPATTAELPSCINSANHVPGTDILVVRRVDTSSLTLAQVAAINPPKGHVYLQSGLTDSGQLDKKMGLGTTATTEVFNLQTMAKPATPTASAVVAQSARLRKFLVHIYFISPCSVIPSGSTTCTSTSDGGNPIPTLKMVELEASGNATTMTTTPLVEGIERMQIDYGLDTTGDGAPDGDYTRTPANWENVMAVQVHLLARNNETSSGYLDKKSYNLGLAGMAAAPSATSAASAAIALTGTQFKRKVFSQQIRLINPSARRDE